MTRTRTETMLLEALADVLLNGGCGTTTECEALARAALKELQP